ncbi:uncharacterized protein LOC132639915 [Lycium barbarum]|uniref:uncharacterized protein LOC132639915 n=1 Tax=Lycium barbarum TaxID=112863 RepID=UPI00293EE4C6|nr:uncharacterized protein LOC132639915 [Lycium barbarum]
MPIPKQASWMIRKILEARVTLQHLQFDPNRPKSFLQQAYLQFIGDRPRVPWKCMVFHNTSRSKAQFNTWLQLQGRLLTAYRLAKWGMDVQQDCVLCELQQETRDHPIVHCNYVKLIWQKVLNWIRQPLRQVATWEQHMAWVLSKAKGRSQQAQVFKMVYTETVYAICLERNQRVFEKKKREWHMVAKDIAYQCYLRAPVGIQNYVLKLKF